MKTAALHNLGCKVNAYETEAMQQALEAAGYEIVSFREAADVYVINTCSVTNMADRKSGQMLRRARANNKDSIVIAVGCYVQTDHERIKADTGADILIGNDKKGELVSLLNDYLAKRAGRSNPTMNDIETNDTGSSITEIVGGTRRGMTAAALESRMEMADCAEYENLTIEKSGLHTRAFVKIQDGCNQFCSYCIIPYARGRVRSRHPNDILAEIRNLSDSGCKEVVLTGIHLSSYGQNISPSSEEPEIEQPVKAGVPFLSYGQNISSPSEEPDVEQPLKAVFSQQGEESPPHPLLLLIQQIHEIKGISRIRLGSLEPSVITETFAEGIAALPKLCPHFHLSLQSGCDATLARMNRKYTTAEYAKACELLRRFYEHPALTTDVIVGFPGESEQEFETTRRFAQAMGFFEVHVFKFSPRKGTKAETLPDQSSEPIKKERSRKLMADTKLAKAEFLSWYQGKEVEVLTEEFVSVGEQTYLSGHSTAYALVYLSPKEHKVNELTVKCIKHIWSEGILLGE
ncbi:tRNA (N(6)-L-threonylcarbamoyladenosine(37)-C(2))-methylthiotransferase MtaB [Clostridia bacterium]|nr:tRNA (N(6)-L-threonylcarbamoyladenosine(37)-C(2))-methylthiotransferase MtaB [Clostridia bacterium]